MGEKRQSTNVEFIFILRPTRKQTHGTERYRSVHSVYTFRSLYSISVYVWLPVRYNTVWTPVLSLSKLFEYRLVYKIFSFLLFGYFVPINNNMKNTQQKVLEGNISIWIYSNLHYNPLEFFAYLKPKKKKHILFNKMAVVFASIITSRLGSKRRKFQSKLAVYFDIQQENHLLNRNFHTDHYSRHNSQYLIHFQTNSMI